MYTRPFIRQWKVCKRPLAVGVRENLEYNIFRLAENARMRAGSYAFNEAAVYVKNSDSTNYSYSLQYMNRLDYGLNEDALRLNSVAHEAKVSFEFLQWKHNRLKGSAVYRNDNVRDTSSQFVSEHNFVGSIDYYGSFWKGAVTLSIYYEAGSGLEQKKNYAFLKVAAGQGTHVWNDYNGNGSEEFDWSDGGDGRGSGRGGYAGEVGRVRRGDRYAVRGSRRDRDGACQGRGVRRMDGKAV